MTWKTNCLIFTSDFIKSILSFSKLRRSLKHVVLTNLLLLSNTTCKFSKNLTLSMRSTSTTTKAFRSCKDCWTRIQMKLCGNSNDLSSQTSELTLTLKTALVLRGFKGYILFSGTNEPRRCTKSKLDSSNAVLWQCKTKCPYTLGQSQSKRVLFIWQVAISKEQICT